MTRYASDRALDKYRLRFSEQPLVSNRNTRMLRRFEELIFKRKSGRGRRITLNGSNIEVLRLDGRKGDSGEASLKVQASSSGLAILRRLGSQYEAPQVEELASIFEDLRLFEVDTVAARRPAPIDDALRLRPDASNLAPFLLRLSREHPERFELLQEDIAYVLPGFRHFKFVVLGGGETAIQLEIVEAPLEGTTPLARASFGTIRAIALFAMLHDPHPPRLTCLEEVDHGLHPHALDRLIERLRDASARTQLIVATHSPAFVNRVDASELVIFERDLRTGATIRPDITPEELREMEERSGFALGELWFSGAIGGGLNA